MFIENLRLILMSSMCLGEWFGRSDVAGHGAEAAAKRCRKGHRGIQATGLKICIQPALREKLILGAQNLQIIADAFLVAKHREVIRIPRRFQRLLLFDPLRGNTAATSRNASVNVWL